jgi:hypothetical protein
MPYHALSYYNAERLVELNYNKPYVAQMSRIQSEIICRYISSLCKQKLLTSNAHVLK